MKARNKVVAGDFKGEVVCGNEILEPYITIGFFKKYKINKDTVESFEVINAETVSGASSGIARGAVGAALVGPVGMLAGATAKGSGVYMVAIKFKDGKNSLIEVETKRYKAIIETLF